MDRDPSEAAEDAVDDDRRLDGEARTSDHRDEAEHWLAVYRELVAFKQDLVTRTQATIEGMLPEAAREVKATDLVVLGAERGRLQRRLDFWVHRAEELGGG